MPEQTVPERLKAFIKDEALIPLGGEVTVLVSGELPMRRTVISYVAGINPART